MNREKMRFKIGSDRQNVDANELAAFAGKAKSHSPNQNHSIQLPNFTQNGERTKTILFRCSINDFEDIAYVFESINIKSRQQLLECILLPEIRRLAKKLQDG